MGSVKAVHFVIIIWPQKLNWYNLLYVLRLLKSKLPKLVLHHVASVYWEIAALIVGYGEIEGDVPLPHPTVCNTIPNFPRNINDCIIAVFKYVLNTHFV